MANEPAFVNVYKKNHVTRLIGFRILDVPNVSPLTAD